jgi:hypothetical protein
VIFTKPLYRSVRRHPASYIPLAHNAAMRATHHVYVIELSKDVLLDAKFMKCNPGYLPGMPCVYVGLTGLDPDVRFDNHGIRANKYAKRFGLGLMTALFEHLNPMPYGDAQYMEVDLGIRLRAQGFGVWQS